MTPAHRLVTRISRFFSGQRGRFLFVGGINTFVGYGLFVFFVTTLGPDRYVQGLVFTHLIATSIAFVLYRRVVFFVRGRILLDYFRFQLVYAGGFLINISLLILFVDTAGIPALVSQAIALLLVVVFTYVAHRYFSFRRGPGSPREQD